jgi:hypothetical protein
MSAAAIVQLVSACIGIIGSLFFAIGVMRQTVEAMALLSGTYWGSNPHMRIALAAQKADYLFGGGLIFVAFVLQLASYFASTEPMLTLAQTILAPWIAGVATVIVFSIFHAASKRLAKHYEVQITEWVNLRREKENTTG